MVRLLVADMIRRIDVRPVGLLFVCLLATWQMLGWQHHASQAVALSLAAAFALGPFLVPLHAATPLTPYLPVSRRDAWRATWLMVGLAALTPAVLMLPAVVLGGAPGWSGWTLSIAMDTAYAGAGCALLAFGGLTSNGPVVPRIDRRWLGTASVSLYVGGPFWSYVFLPGLPTHWGDVGPRWTLGLIAGFACAAGAWFYTPPLAARTRRRERRQLGTRSLSARVFGTVSGIPRLMLHEFAFSGWMAVTTGLAMAAVGYFAGAFSGSIHSVADFVRGQTLRVFAPALTTQPDLQPLDQLLWYGLFSAAVGTRFPDMLRHLRVLPVGAARLHAVLLAWPALFWSAAWVVLAIVHVALTGTHAFATLRLDLLVFYAALTALGQALVLRFQSLWVRSLSGVPMMVPFVWLASGGMSWMFVGLAGVAIAGAIAINANAFGRASTYKRVSFGRARTESI
jgi:hypothetical protein